MTPKKRKSISDDEEAAVAPHETEKEKGKNNPLWFFVLKFIELQDVYSLL